MFILQFFVSSSLFAQVDRESVKKNNPTRNYYNVAFGYPISFINKEASSILKNDMNLKVNLNNTFTSSFGTMISNVKNNFGGKFCVNLLNQAYKSDSLELRLSLYSLTFGLNYRLNYKKWLFDFDMNMGTLMSYQGLTFKKTEIQDLYQSIDNQQGNYTFINSKPIFNLAFSPRVHYKVHPFLSIFLNYEYHIANNSNLGKLKNQTLFTNSSFVQIGVEYLLNLKSKKEK
jgi:hypothetical protein